MAEDVSWFDRLKSLVGLGEAQQQTVLQEQLPAPPNSDGLVDMLSGSLNINSAQAAGGMGAILNYVKAHVSAEQFSQLSQSLPGVEGLVAQMPDINKLSSVSSEGFSGLLDQVAQYSDSLKSINDVKKQFEALGLKPEMVTSFITTAQSYLDTEQGQQAKQVLAEGLGKLLG